MSIQYGDGGEAARAAPGPDRQVISDFNPALGHEVILGRVLSAADTHSAPPGEGLPLDTMVQTTGLTTRPGEDDTPGSGGLENGSTGSGESFVEPLVAQ